MYSSSYRGKQSRENNEDQETELVLINIRKGTVGGKPTSTWARLIHCIFEVDSLRCNVDFECRQVLVREGKGGKDRLTILPALAEEPLKAHLRLVEKSFPRDLKRGEANVKLPGALDRKFPNATRESPWQWVFPATRKYRDPNYGLLFRHHLHETVVQKAVRRAALRAELAKRITCHTFRHSFVTHLLDDGYDIRTVQALLGHKDVKSPADHL